MAHKFFAVALHFDSLAEAYGFPSGYRDPTFSEVANRFMLLAHRFSLRYSIYVIGKDLEPPENREAVKRWADKGHEIGNHSWSHPIDLGSRSAPAIAEEVSRAHERIAQTVGTEPRGFIAPNWCGSRTLLDELIRCSYEYDMSLFPSPMLYILLLKLALNHIGDPRMLSVFRRRDFLSPFLAPRRAHRHRSVSGCIIEIPLPSNRFRIVCWHTLAFRLGWRTYERLLRSILREEDFVCYVVHPADLICQEDMDPSRRTRAERMSVPFPVKLRLFENSLACLMEDGRQCLTMQEMANAISKRLPGPSSAPAR